MRYYNFDNCISRRGTDCIKFDWAKENGYEEDILSYWVADMDYTTAEEITQAIVKRAQHGIYGYTLPKQDYWSTVTAWMQKHYGFEVLPEWGFYTPGVVFAISSAIKAFTKAGDAVLVQRPVYYPFSRMITDNQRTLVNSPLKLIHTKNGMHYEMDYDDFEQKVIKHQVKLFLLCNPHNPGGRVWSREELEKIGEICVRHDVIVVSDEIHADFTFGEYQHTVFAGIKKEFLNRTITCTSPTKTFNLAGLQISNIFCANASLRERILAEIGKTGYDEPNIFGQIACKAAYTYGEEWLRELKDYLYENFCYVQEFLKEKLPKIQMMDIQGTYLAWLDFSAYGLSNQELEQKIVQEARLWLDSGTMFGEEGTGFQRINIGTSRAYLQQGLDALYRVFKEM